MGRAPKDTMSKSIRVKKPKIDYPNLTFVNRHVIRLIMFLTNGPTNIDKTYEFTDWQSVKRFSNELDI